MSDPGAPVPHHLKRATEHLARLHERRAELQRLALKHLEALQALTVEQPPPPNQETTP